MPEMRGKVQRVVIRGDYDASVHLADNYRASCALSLFLRSRVPRGVSEPCLGYRLGTNDQRERETHDM
jgi:hypothetical protein